MSKCSHSILPSRLHRSQSHQDLFVLMLNQNFPIQKPKKMPVAMRRAPRQVSTALGSVPECLDLASLCFEVVDQRRLVPERAEFAVYDGQGSRRAGKIPPPQVSLS